MQRPYRNTCFSYKLFAQQQKREYRRKRREQSDRLSSRRHDGLLFLSVFALAQRPLTLMLEAYHIGVFLSEKRRRGMRRICRWIQRVLRRCLLNTFSASNPTEPGRNLVKRTSGCSCSLLLAFLYLSRETYTYNPALVTLVGASFLVNLHRRRDRH